MIDDADVATEAYWREDEVEGDARGAADAHTRSRYERRPSALGIVVLLGNHLHCARLAERRIGCESQRSIGVEW